jgi:hypothetical protein
VWVYGIRPEVGEKSSLILPSVFTSERERDAEQSTPKRVRFVWLQIERKRLGKNQIPGFSKLGS